jgi:hypothetical protein
MSKWILMLLAFLVPVSASLAIADAAGAATGFGRLGSFAEAPKDGLLSHNRRIAVNWSTGDIYKTDTLNDRIVVYRPNATGADELTTFATGVAISDPLGIAIDQDNGDVFVSDADNIVKYDSDGAPTPTFTLDGSFNPGVTGPIAFDQAANELVVADRAANQVKRFTTAGALTGTPFNGNDGSSTAFTGLQDLAVDSTGDIIVIDATAGGDPALGIGSTRVERFTSAGVDEGSIGPVAGAATVTTIPSSDDVVVSGNQDAVLRNEFPTVSVFDSSGALTKQLTLDQPLRYATVFGLAADDGATGRLYIASDVDLAYNGGGGYGSIGIEAYELGVLPEVTLAAPTNVTATGATLSGSVNPGGGSPSTAYRFEYSSDGGETWTASDPDNDGDEDAGSGSTAVAVGGTLTGLNYGTSYLVRIVATKGALPMAIAEESFTTTPAEPTITGANAVPSQTGARLSAKINPNAGDTTWTFEYGTTTAYGKQFPIAPAAIAAGFDPVAVVRTVGDLEPGTTYHFRTVATNVTGTSHGGDVTFMTKTPGAPADDDHGGRAYEQVTPADTGGTVPYDTGTLPIFATADGNRIAFGTPSGLPGSPTSVQLSYNVAERGPTNWRSRSAEVAQSSPREGQAVFTWLTTEAFSSDLRRSITTSTLPLAPGAIEGGTNLYEKDIFSGDVKLLYANPDITLLKERQDYSYAVDYFGASADLSHLLLKSDAPLTSDAPPGVHNVFEFANGAFNLASKVNDSPVLSGVNRNLAISDDGRRIAFTVSGDDSVPGPIYLRQDGREAIPISVEEGIVHDARLVGFNRGLDFLYITMGRVLYRYDVDARSLTKLTTPQDPDDNDPIAPEAISADGATAYFQYSHGHNTIAVAHDDSVTDITEQDRYLPEGFNVSSSGRFLAFVTRGQITAFDPHDPSCPVGLYGDRACSEVYVYDRDTDELRCASCRPGAIKNADSTLPTSSDRFRPRGLVVLDDGRVFYDSNEALVDGDVNGKGDVYEWSWATQANRLISPGHADASARVQAVTPDGKSVFFKTTERLVAQDRDDLGALYVAREGGGLPEQNVVTGASGSCVEDSCQGAPRPAPGPGSVGSGRSGTGDVSAVTPAVIAASISGGTPTAKQRAALAKGKTATVKVTVNQSGTVAIIGKAEIAGKQATVLSARQQARKAGTLSLKLKLSAAGLKALKRTGSLRVTFAVQFSGVSEPRKVTATLKQPKRKARGASRPGMRARASSPIPATTSGR